MYRVIVTATFLAMLAVALGSAGLAWWSASEARYQLERTRMAGEVLDGHLRLQAGILDMFAPFAGGSDRLDEPRARASLEAELDRLRSGIAREIALVDSAAEKEQEAAELLRLAAIERRIEGLLERLAEAQSLVGRERDATDDLRLARLLQEASKDPVGAQIDEAVADEQGEVDAAHAEAEAALQAVSTVARIVAGVALVLCAASLFLLLTRLRRPLEELVSAARAVTAGDFDRRVAVRGRDEFSRVGDSFNTMVDEVARSRKALEDSRQGLERAVAERTAELAAANASLTRADESRRRFIADISHELRTPLTVIRGEAEVALRGQEKPPVEYRTALQRVAEQAVHTGRLVDDLLFVARAEAGEPRMTMQRVGLASLIERTCADAAVLAEPRRVRIELEESAEVTVQGDRGRLHQLVLILLDNAVRYSDPGGIVSVTLGAHADGAVLRVTDHGPGIPEDEVGLVFERFYRGANAARRHAEGSGLGLPLARTIVTAHGGEIALGSRPGAGTTVTVRLPAAGGLQAVA